MYQPNTNSLEYEAFLDFLATGGRMSEALSAYCDPNVLEASLLVPRARAMTASLITISNALVRSRSEPS